MTVFFSADDHFGNESIIRNAGRPFACAEEMDEVLIQNWNARIRANSILYYLGDFAHRCEPARLKRIWGRLTMPKQIHLVPGNHDGADTLALPWTSVASGILTVSASNRRFALFHYPLRSWPGLHRGAIHLFGHSHNRLRSYRNAMDVGIDAWHYGPTAIDEILARAERLPESPDAEPYDGAH